MKKRLIGTLLMGALFVSSTSVFVSCKDYDDDINNIVATKADKTALEEAKQALQNEINGLRTQLEDVQGKITTLQNNKADKFTENGKEYNLVDVWTSLKPLIEKTAALETRIGSAEDAIKDINILLGGKLEGDLADKTYKQALQDTWAKAAAASTQAAQNLQAINDLKAALDDPTTGLKAVVADLGEQVKALNAYKARVEAIEADYLKDADKQALIKQINDTKTALETAIETAKTAAIAAAAEDATAKADAAKKAAIEAAAADATQKANDAKAAAIAAASEDAKQKANAAKLQAIAAANEYTNQEIAALNIDSLKTAVKNLSDRVDANTELLNVLNVYVRQALRGLVFSMDSFYQGVEATELTVLWYKKYFLDATNADAVEGMGYKTYADFNGWTPETGDYEPLNYSDYDDDEEFEEDLAERLAEHEFEWANAGKTAADSTRRYRSDVDANGKEVNSRILKFQAKYFMNPSSAAVSNEKGAVTVVAANKPFHSGLDTEDRRRAHVDAEFNGQDVDYEAGIGVKDWETKDGVLIVNYTCTNPAKIMSIRNNDAITVFATQVKEDTLTVTSDFAALYKQDVENIRISHTPSTSKAMIQDGKFIGSHAADSVNTHCGACAYDPDDNTASEYAAGLHLMQTVSEAAGIGTGKVKDSPLGGFSCQDSCGWNDTLDLQKLVEIHCDYVDANGDVNHRKMNADMIEAFGLHFNFVLTGLYYGSNKTSESAHAAIKHQGDSVWYFRPQMPKGTKDHAVATSWDNGGKLEGSVGKQSRQTIGRTPLVRVELLNDSNEVVDYGYIRIKIVEFAKEVVETNDVFKYEAGAMTISQAFCADLAGAPFNFAQTWDQMEWDILHFYDFTQEEFEANYAPDGEGDEFYQFYLNANKEIKPCYDPVESNSDKDYNKHVTLGSISRQRNADNEQTSIVKWIVTGAQLKAYVDCQLAGHSKIEAADVIRYVRFKKNANSTLAGPSYFYICIIPSAFTISDKPVAMGTVDWTGRKIANYWYETDKATAGTDEVHANVFGVENMRDICDTLDKVIPAVFEGNKIVMARNMGDAAAAAKADSAKFIKLNEGSGITAEKLALRLEFVQKDSVFKGILDGDTVQIITRPDFKKNDVEDFEDAKYVGKRALIAYVDANNNLKWDANEVWDTIATLEFTDASKKDINHMKIKYFDEDKDVEPYPFKSTIAKALLNYRAHNALDGEFLTANVAVGAKYKTCDVPLENNTFNVRFLRPINVASNDKAVQDADKDPQKISLLSMVKFSDWRDLAFDTKFWFYYQIKSIEVVGVGDEDDLRTNKKIMTNLGADNVDAALTKALANVSQEVLFTYHAPETAYVAEYDQAPNDLDFGYIEYENLGSTMRDFKVRVPLKVTYYWGDVYTYADIVVKKTLNNARRAK